ncbi:Uncharacterized protein HZ326_26576 [Fusarium oxysporum f. sp. albedinis]|nr:Uncharacterized protein HZ326_26576 [Fusarium oxysporum f. sp. albedinis]
MSRADQGNQLYHKEKPSLTCIITPCCTLRSYTVYIIETTPVDHIWHVFYELGSATMGSALRSSWIYIKSESRCDTQQHPTLYKMHITKFIVAVVLPLLWVFT